MGQHWREQHRRHRCQIQGLFPALLLCCLPLGALSDALSELPMAWEGRLTAVAEADLSGAEPHARVAIAEQRREVAGILADTHAAVAELAEAYGRLGALYQLQGLAATAQPSYANAMALDPGQFRWAYYAGYLAARSGRHEEAIKLYQNARQLRPDYLPLQLRLGEGWLELGRLEQARATLNALAAEPGLGSLALFRLAQIDLLQRLYPQAIDKLQRVLKLDPQADAVHYALARAFRAQGENDRARRHMALQGKQLPQADDPLIRELEELNQGARRFFSQGLRASQTRDFAAAAQSFARGLEIEANNFDARVSYARALFLSDQAERAAQELEAVLHQAPGHTLALFLSAILLENQGEATQALQRYRQLLDLDPQHYGAHFCLANRLYLNGEYAQAADHFHAALAINPEIPPARIYELLALKRSGTSDSEILGRLEQLILNHPEQQILRYTLIRLLLLSEDDQVRDTERARQGINELVQQAFIPPHVELQARVAAAVGNFKQAAELQQQVMPALLWMGQGLQEQAKTALAAYRQEKLPETRWYEETLVLRPPATDAQLMLREYPAAVPY